MQACSKVAAGLGWWLSLEWPRGRKRAQTAPGEIGEAGATRGQGFGAEKVGRSRGGDAPVDISKHADAHAQAHHLQSFTSPDPCPRSSGPRLTSAALRLPCHLARHPAFRPPISPAQPWATSNCRPSCVATRAMCVSFAGLTLFVHTAWD